MPIHGSMKQSSNNTSLKITIAVIIIGAILPFIFTHVIGNKQIFDFNKQHFNYAYIDFGDRVEKIEVKNWMDWDNSDTIQIISKDRKIYYTHTQKVVLVNE